MRPAAHSRRRLVAALARLGVYGVREADVQLVGRLVTATAFLGDRVFVGRVELPEDHAAALDAFVTMVVEVEDRVAAVCFGQVLADAGALRAAKWVDPGAPEAGRS